MEVLNHTLAIDFGTSNSSVYLFKNHSEVLCDQTGSYLFPSYVEYSKNNIITGFAAKRNIGKSGKYVVSCVKRLIGLTYEEYELLDKIHSTNIFKFPRDRDSLISYIKKFIDEKKEYQKQRSRRIDAFSEAASTLNDKSIPSFKKFSSFKELMEVFVEEIYWYKIIYNQIQIMIY